MQDKALESARGILEEGDGAKTESAAIFVKFGARVHEIRDCVVLTLLFLC